MSSTRGSRKVVQTLALIFSRDIAAQLPLSSG